METSLSDVRLNLSASNRRQSLAQLKTEFLLRPVFWFEWSKLVVGLASRWPLSAREAAVRHDSQRGPHLDLIIFAFPIIHRRSPALHGLVGCEVANSDRSSVATDSAYLCIIAVSDEDSDRLSLWAVGREAAVIYYAAQSVCFNFHAFKVFRVVNNASPRLARLSI